MENPRTEKMRVLISVAILIISLHAFSQELSGKVIDAETKEPILFGTVYFASTSIGSVSDADGKFKIWNFDPGKYDLTISHVGYKTYYLPMSFEAGESKEILIELVQDVVELPDFYLNPDTSSWKYNFVTFKKSFIGSTANAPKTTVLNPEKLFFYYDELEETLFAHAKEPIEVENKALGYKVTYSLEQFESNFKQKQLYTFGVSRFEQLKKKKRMREKRKITKAREKAYNGSMTHFFRSIQAGRLTSSGFVVEELFRIPNPHRPSQDEIIRNIEKYKMLARAERQGTTRLVSVNSSASDSLSYWYRMRREPVLIDSVGRKMNESPDLQLNSDGKVFFKGILRVRYLNEKEEFGYTRISGKRYAENYQTSVIHFLDDSLRIYENGYYEDVKSIFIEGYWNWTTNLAELLPLDYSPPVAPIVE